MIRLAVLLLLVWNLQVFAQGYADNWAIPNGFGMNFTSGIPIPFVTQTYHYLPFLTNSSTSSISDNQGNLLFYQTEDSIFSSNHQMMDNGYGIFSSYGMTNTYPSCIIPSLVNDSLYYLFYVSRYDKGGGVLDFGLFYSLINIKLNNGLGKVILKNQILVSQAVNIGFISPMYNEVKGRYEIHFTTVYTSAVTNAGARMAILDSNGISLLSPPNPAYQLSGNSCRWNVASDCLACVSQHNAATNMGIVYLWKYNKSNSVFTLDKTYEVPDFDGLGGACFSPSGRFLYISCHTSGWSTTKLWRYDVFQPDSISTVNSKINLLSSNYPQNYKSAVTRLQLAADQKIYCTVLSEGFFLVNNPNPVTIGVINHPDSTYVGNFSANAVSNLGKKPVEFPNFVLNWIARPPFSLRHACQDSVVFDLTYKNIVDSVFWDFGDPASGALNYSSALSPVHKYSSYGKYFVQVLTCWDGTCDTLTDTVFVEPQPHVTLPHDTLLCPGGSVHIDIRQGFNATYLWNTGSTDSVLTLNQTGSYIVTVFNHCGSSTDTMNITVLEPPKAQLHDTTLCDNYRVVLHFDADEANFLWSTGDTTSSIYPIVSGLYSVSVQNPCGSINDQAHVEYKKCICNVYVPNAFTPDGDGLNDFFGPVADCPNFTFTMHILDRWGNVVAEITEKTPPWDGTVNGQPAPLGVYNYRFIYRGTEYDLTKQEWINGTVTVLR